MSRAIAVHPTLRAYAIAVAVLALIASVFVATNVASAESQIVRAAELYASDGAAGDSLGNAVDTDGTWTIMGARTADFYGTNSGAAYLSAYSGTRWSVPPTRLDPWDSAWQDFDGAQFGSDVAIDGQWAVVSAPGMDNGTTNNMGAIYIYRLQNGAWEQSVKRWGPGSYSGFGSAVAVDGNTIAVSAPDMNEASQGRVYLYKWNGSGWASEGFVVASDTSVSDYFGRDLDLSGDTLVVDHRYDGNGNAHVFTRSGSTWTEQAILTHSDPGPGQNFGHAVAIDGATIAVAAPGTASQTGEVFVFNGAGASWSSDAVLLAPNRATGDSFGWSVDVDAGRIAVGAYGYDAYDTNSGATWVFSGSGSDWTPFPIIDGQIEDADHWGVEYENATNNGVSVAISGVHVASGAINDGEDPATTRTGSVHMKQLEPGADASTYNDRGVSVTFSNITAPGYHSSTGDPRAQNAFEATPRIDSVNAAPTGYVMTDGALYDLWTNVSFSGTFMVTLPYHEDNVPNWLNVDGPVDEADLKMLHFDGESWVDITASVDTANNTVSGVASSFSEFVIVESGEATSNPYFDWDPAGANAGSLDTPHKDYRLTTSKCQVCHLVHAAPADGELLLPTTRANACIYCHITTTLGGIVIYNGDPDTYLVENDYGHQYDGGGGVACADCHSVHGANTIGGDQGLETKILHAGGYQSELVTRLAGGDETSITIGGQPGSQRWGVQRWDEAELQRTAFCTRCHEYYSHTSTETVGPGAGYTTHPLRDYFDPVWPNPGAPDRFGLGIAVADHTTRGCTWFCHETYDPDLGTELWDLGVGIHEGSFPHYTPKHDKFLMADDIPAVDSDTDDVCFECHLWNPGVEGAGETF